MIWLELLVVGLVVAVVLLIDKTIEDGDVW